MTIKPLARTLLPILSLLLAFSMLAFQHIVNQEESKTKLVEYGVNVVELFTSQGCSSCPPADVLLTEIKDDENVIALSYHVDYWNYLGWKDPYSSEEFSNYQRSYAQKLNGGVYTPQMVMNGDVEFVGSQKSVLTKKIKNKSNVQALEAPIVSYGDEKLEFSYSMENIENFDSAYALLVLDEKTTKVGKGENSRKDLKNSNVVLQRIALSNHDKSGKQSFKLNKNQDSRSYKIAIVAQNKDLQILAAGISTL